MRLLHFHKWILIWLLPVTQCCAQSLPKPYLNLGDEALVYDFSLTFRENYLSGIAIIKQETAGSHVVVLSKFGLTIMDFMLLPQEANWKITPPGFDKASRLRALENDFRLLLLTPLSNPEKYKVKSGNRFDVAQKLKIEIRSDGKNEKVVQAASRQFPFKSVAYYVYLPDEREPSEICLKRRLPELEIKLTKTAH